MGSGAANRAPAFQKVTTITCLWHGRSENIQTGPEQIFQRVIPLQNENTRHPRGGDATQSSRSLRVLGLCFSSASGTGQASSGTSAISFVLCFSHRCTQRRRSISQCPDVNGPLQVHRHPLKPQCSKGIAQPLCISSRPRSVAVSPNTLFASGSAPSGALSALGSAPAGGSNGRSRR